MKSYCRTIHPELASWQKNGTVILGGGLAGLSSGFVLVRAGQPVMVVESDSAVGGLSKTVVKGEFRFDLGGHRFLTKNEKIENFVRDLLKGDFLTVSRKSKIYMYNKFFDYPLKPSNAIFGLGISTTLKVITDYSKEKIRNFFISPSNVSLEDWVVSNFGRTMFNLYFKEYSEKVWGIESRRISKEWVAQRIRGLSLWTAMKNAFFKFSGKDIDTLAGKFIYPSMGIGDISDRLSEEIEKENSVLTNTRVTQINHSDYVVRNIVARNCAKIYDVGGKEFISSIPLPNLIRMLNPPAPDDIIEAASRLKYRAIVIVVIMLNCESVTDLTWMHLPERDIPIGRIHEPKNWSPNMAPRGKTHIVAEYFCFEGDNVWNSPDNEITSVTIKQLIRLGFIRESEVIDSCVVKGPRAYPLFEVGYEEHYNKIIRYLKNFKNLHIIGRSGMFRYYNMDHAIESGIEVAEDILEKSGVMKQKDSQLIGA
ncbi:MAG: FAD-dependent oxidoreductase [Candidatus Mariimomonas ferrooxydans]